MSQAADLFVYVQVVEKGITTDDRIEAGAQIKIRHPLVIDAYSPSDLCWLEAQLVPEKVEHPL